MLYSSMAQDSHKGSINPSDNNVVVVCGKYPSATQQVGQDTNVLERTFKILHLVKKQYPVGILKLHGQTGYPVHEVRYSLDTLKSYGLLRATPMGVVPSDDFDQVIRDTKVSLKNIAQQLRKIEKGL